MRISELYQEPKGGTFTHDDATYDLNALLRVTDDSEIHDIPLDELEWVFDYDNPGAEYDRVESADLNAPIIVTWWRDDDDGDHKLVVLDGLHRIAKASENGLEYVKGIYVDAPELERCRLNEGLVDDAIQHFGVTNDPRECGYLMPNGEMLDLSGKHWMVGGDYRRVDGRNVIKRGSDYQAGLRHVDHRDLDELSEKGGTEGMLEFMQKTGAIRVMPPYGFNLAVYPTKKQIAMMCVMAQFYGEEQIYLESFDEAGYVDANMSFTDLNPAKVMSFLAKANLARIA